MATTTTETPASQLAGALEHLLTGVMDTVTREGTIVKIVAGGLPFELVVLPGTADPLAHVKEGDHIDRDAAARPRQRQALSGICARSRSRSERVQSQARTPGPAHRLERHRTAVRCMVVWGGTAYGRDDGRSAGAHRSGRHAAARPVAERPYRERPLPRQRSRRHLHSRTGSPGPAHRHVLQREGVRRLACGRRGRRRRRRRRPAGGRRRSMTRTRPTDRTSPTRAVYDIRGDECTRESGHPGQHIAGDGELVLDRCPQ
jgi:hypothetical protein